MEDVSSTVGVMRELKSLGIRLAIDDFGIGYTSLSYLKRFPVDYLKLVRSFTGELEKGAGDRVTLTAIIDIAHALSLEVLAEGIEDAGQLARLQELGCDLAQRDTASPNRCRLKPLRSCWPTTGTDNSQSAATNYNRPGATAFPSVHQ